MTKKYRIDYETNKIVNDKKVYRIVALKNFTCGNDIEIKKGDVGGYIQSYKNLSQTGGCWVGDNAIVIDDAIVYEDAYVFGEAFVNSKARVCGKAMVYDNARIYDYSEVNFYAKVYGNAIISQYAHIRGDAQIFGNAHIYEHAVVYSGAKIYGRAEIAGQAQIYRAVVRGDAVVTGLAVLKSDDNDNKPVIEKKAIVGGLAKIIGKVKISDLSDYMVIQNNFSSGRPITWTKSNNMWATGCFYGTEKELLKRAYFDSKEKGDKFKELIRFVKKFNKS